ncbi:MAG: TOBE domain-containing protein [Hyphomicrobiaceae bacterium]|nr:MAG: TOBE domain-containing protein [Hyphomicrobiaceae bacterium]
MAVAAFVGTPQMNLMAGSWANDAVTVDGHVLQVAQTTPVARDVMLGVRPSDLRIGPAGLPAHIERIEDMGDTAIISLTAGGRSLKVKGDLQNARKGGDHVFLSFAPHAAHLFDPNDGSRL